jgi:enoyl-CoA hydratase/carnithine racemase
MINYAKEGRIAVFTLDRQPAMNAMNVEGLKELSKAMIAFRDDPEVWVGIITGAGEKAFCGGADIKDTLPFMKDHRNDPWNFPPEHWRGLEVYKPLIAAVNGMALGGGLEIALACDLRIAAENARFGAPEVTLGLIPGWGATQRLPRIIPWCKAAELMFLGKPIDAQEAYRIGLVNKVVPQAELMTAARQWAEAICNVGPLAVQAAKEAMIKGYSLPLDEGLGLESALFGYLLGTEDYKEATTAFIEKRKPVYKAK